ncbi:MAG: AAA family ATPase, partial [Nitrospira sp.]|nr:AAA family ATPase [Nitrospira sp.]
MRLKSLELTGFKSFSEAKIEFPQGVTAVVGPNGTGKSNVVDAILWVLGEQSTKTLRSERMEDVIFNGTERRKPLGMAEVSLIVSGLETQQLVDFPSLERQLGEYHEVMVTRRLYRNGDSEYLINKTPCRLKDIRSLFLDTRAGSKGHTVIEQGRIEQILNASPQDRRELIEETAGIVRYKKQKAETLRKLDSTQHNLLRVRDIIAEIRQRVTALDRQARQARSYRGLQDEARTIEIRLLVRDYRQLVATQAEVDSELAALELQESAQAAQQARLTSELQEVRLKLESHEQALAKFRDEVAHVERQQTQAVTVVEVERNRLGILEEQRGQAVQELTRLGLEQQRADAEIAGLRAKRAHAEAEIAERERILAEQEATDRSLTTRRGAALESVEQSRRDVLDITVQATSGDNALTDLTHRVEEVARRIERLTKEQTELEVQKAGVLERIGEVTRRREDQERQLGEQRREREARQTASQQLEGRLRGAEQRASRQQEELASVESRLRALQGIVREEMGYGREGEEEATSVRAVCAGVREAVAEWLTMPPQFERAIEAALGERARAWLVEAPDQAREAIAFLTGKGLGRGAFVPLSPRWSAGLMGGGSQDWWSALAGQPGVLGKALDVIHAPEESRRALLPLFEGVVIVDTLHKAVKLWERGLWSAPGGPTLVTLEGEVLDAAGIMIGGTTGGPIQRRREIQELEEKKGGLVQELQDIRGECEQVAVQHGSAKADAQRLEGEIHAAEMRQLGFAKDQAGLQESVEGLERRVEIVRTERAADQEERVGVEREIESAQEQLNRFVREKADREAELVEASRALQATDEETLGIHH